MLLRSVFSILIGDWRIWDIVDWMKLPYSYVFVDTKLLLVGTLVLRKWLFTSCLMDK